MRRRLGQGKGQCGHLPMGSMPPSGGPSATAALTRRRRCAACVGRLLGGLSGRLGALLVGPSRPRARNDRAQAWFRSDAGGCHGQEAGRCAAQARGIRCRDLAGARPARARVDEDLPGARRRGLSRPVAQTWAPDRFEGGAAPERAFRAARVGTRTPGRARLARNSVRSRVSARHGTSPGALPAALLAGPRVSEHPYVSWRFATPSWAERSKKAESERKKRAVETRSAV